MSAVLQPREWWIYAFRAVLRGVRGQRFVRRCGRQQVLRMISSGILSRRAAAVLPFDLLSAQFRRDSVATGGLRR